MQADTVSEESRRFNHKLELYVMVGRELKHYFLISFATQSQLLEAVLAGHM